MILPLIVGVGSVLAARRLSREISKASRVQRTMKDPMVRRCLESANVTKDGFAHSAKCDRVWLELEALSKGRR